MMAAVINLIRGPLGFAVCQSDICPSCHLNSAAAFDVSAPLTCNLSNVGSCGYLEGDRSVIIAKTCMAQIMCIIILSGSDSVLGGLQDGNLNSQDYLSAV